MTSADIGWTDPPQRRQAMNLDTPTAPVVCEARVIVPAEAYSSCPDTDLAVIRASSFPG